MAHLYFLETYIFYCLPILSKFLSLNWYWTFIFASPFILQSLTCLSSAPETMSGSVGWKAHQLTPRSWPSRTCFTTASDIPNRSGWLLLRILSSRLFDPRRNQIQNWQMGCKIQTKDQDQRTIKTYEPCNEKTFGISDQVRLKQA